MDYTDSPKNKETLSEVIHQRESQSKMNNVKNNGDNSTNEKVILEPFVHQVGGHNVFLAYNSYLLCKVFNPDEYLFYKYMSVSLEDFIPKFNGLANVHRRVDENDSSVSYVGSCINEGDINPTLITTCEVQNEKDRWEENYIQRSNSIDKVIRQKRYHPWYIEARKRFDLKWEKYKYDEKIFLMLENVTTKYEKPCVLDVKIGFRAHGDNTESTKLRRKIERCQNTTTSKCGIRLCGLQTYHVKTDSYTFLNKYNGRILDIDQLKEKLKEYFFDGELYRYELIEPFIKRLNSLIATLEQLASLRLFATSVLLVYEGNLTHEQSLELTPGEIENFLDLRLIDFAQASFEMPQDSPLSTPKSSNSTKHIGPDESFMLGLSNLVDIFKTFLDCYDTNNVSN